MYLENLKHTSSLSYVNIGWWTHAQGQDMTHLNIRTSFQFAKCTMSLKDLSVAPLRSALWHEFGNAVPDEEKFNVGTFRGKQCSVFQETMNQVASH